MGDVSPIALACLPHRDHREMLNRDFADGTVTSPGLMKKVDFDNTVDVSFRSNGLTLV